MEDSSEAKKRPQTPDHTESDHFSSFFSHDLKTSKLKLLWKRSNIHFLLTFLRLKQFSCKFSSNIVPCHLEEQTVSKGPVL